MAPCAGSCAASASPADARPGPAGDADDPQTGDVICYTDDLDEPLKISVGGTPGDPIVYSGDGSTRVPGITATADDVVVQGFMSDGADSTGIWASGKNVTVQDNTVTRVRHTDDEVDAIRFFGDGFRVLHNTVRDLEVNDVGDSHVDCIQTYATSQPGSLDVVIQGNRCEGIRARDDLEQRDGRGGQQGVRPGQGLRRASWCATTGSDRGTGARWASTTRRPARDTRVRPHGRHAGNVGRRRGNSQVSVVAPTCARGRRMAWPWRRERPGVERIDRLIVQQYDARAR